MTDEELIDFADSVKSTVKALSYTQKYVGHLERVIKQAVMTNGGVLYVNPELAEQAKDCKLQIIMSDGKITLEQI